ncbi:Phosphoesterase, DHHA1 [Alteracholeplasma palmae J233]|uniref:Phosphoesterase, DHHA1 n=1 Tax=Alteracholeplasma palmae (strain ATCC 49389 / J233) TaxID=1318466 RepID=U4KLV3_ALTPJ|nr:bifunctional oligoribonuclease/PAP phosphatase NrnA [Alteracholeplasma palmae]CCV64994.1 Phosphoesterase, DHHA1 [Alteracholeplasma palmae J233]
MKTEILNYIKKYQTIIIHRHARPDMDAIGSQIGLQQALKENFPEKDIYVVGDLNPMSYKAKMDDITDDTYKDALVFILDCAVSHMISDDRYKLAKDVIIIDHHTNPSDIENTLFYQQSTYTSACEILVELVKDWNFKINQECATYLYGGMVTDTGRFLYVNENNASHAFLMASYITQFKPDIKDFYDFLYTESLEKRQVKNLFSEFSLTEHNVAYRKNTAELVSQSKLDVQGVSRGMINQMAGLKEVKIWASFTEDKEKNIILGEFRARDITIVDIAKKYGGGGHNQACGATLTSWEQADLIINDLDERAKENL